MAGSLTLGGGMTGLPSGSFVLGPSTFVGTSAVLEVFNVALAPSAEKSFTPPTGTQVVACFFAASSTGSEMRIGSNFEPAQFAFPLAAKGFFVSPLAAGITKIAFFAASSPPTFQVVFIG